jgi:hypothetical protein
MLKRGLQDRTIKAVARREATNVTIMTITMGEGC